MVFGSTEGFPAVFPLASLYPAAGGDGSGGFVLTGVESLDAAIGARWSVSTAGDVNGDGVADLITGANWARPRGHELAGASYVVFGSTQDFPAVFALSSLRPFAGGDGSRGFVLPGIDAGDGSGVSVSAAGDVNADGIDDLIVGAPSADPNGDSSAGESYVVFGRTAAP